MKNPLLLFRHVAAVAILLVMLFGTTSCIEDKEGADFIVEYFTVNRGDWYWNDIYERYEYEFAYNMIDNYVYNETPVVAGVYVIENDYDDRGRPINYEVFKPMPFVQSYRDGAFTYTETIGYHISPGWIKFYIQASDLSDTDQYLATYDFKVNIFYNR